MYKIHMAKPSIDESEKQAVIDCLDRKQLSSGKKVKELEKIFSEMHFSNAIAVNSGTSALHLALLSLGIGRGDEVILPTCTYIASANAITYAQAKPVVVDINYDDLTININQVEKAINKKTKAIMAVHLYSMPARLNELQNICAKHGLYLIEDACESIGSKYNNRYVGSFGDAAAFSLFAGKIIVGAGEGGILLTNQIEKARYYAGVAQSDKKYWHTDVGYNMRYNEIGGAIAVEQMKKLQQMLEIRKSIYNQYKQGLSKYRQQTATYNHDISAWVFPIVFESVEEKEYYEKKLSEAEVETRPIFFPISKMPMYYSKKKMVVAEELNKRGLLLPLHCNMTSDDVKYICDVLK